MAIPLDINGAVFEYPENFNEGWGVAATGWAQAVTNGMLQMQGGSFPLTADVNFGPNFGLLSKYFETRSANPAGAGTVRLSSADAGIAWRNNANSANLILTTNSTDQLLYNGQVVALSGGGTGSSPTFTNVTLTNSLILDDDQLTPNTITVIAPTTVPSSWTLTLPTDDGSAGQVLSTDGSGITTWINAAGGGTVNSGTANQLAYYAGTGTAVSSNPNFLYNHSPGFTQLEVTDTSLVGVAMTRTANGFQGRIFVGNSGGGNNLISIQDVTNARFPFLYNALGNTVTTAGAWSFDTAIDMTSHQINNVADGSSAQDAVAFGQVTNVQMGTLSGQVSSAATSFTNTGLAVTVTPKSATSKILIVVTGAGSHNPAAGHVEFSLARNTTNLGGSAGISAINVGSNGGSSVTTNYFIPVSVSYLDSPATTSAVTYNLTYRGTAGPSLVFFGYAGSVSTITVYEIPQ